MGNKDGFLGVFKPQKFLDQLFILEKESCAVLCYLLKETDSLFGPDIFTLENAPYFLRKGGKGGLEVAHNSW